MLAVFDRLTRREDRDSLQFIAVAPTAGPLADALCERGIEVHPLPIRDDSGRRLPSETAAANLRTTLREGRADLVHANSLAMGRLTGAMGDAFPVPRFVHLRDIVGLSKAAIGDLNRNDRLIAVSEATRTFHVEQGLSPEKTTVLYNGVDGDVFQPRAATGGLKRELALPDEAFLALTVGQIGLRKGQGVLAEAAVRLKDALPNLHFLIVGERHSNKPESIEFERAIAGRFTAAGMAHRLHRLGRRDDVLRLMNEADLLVHPAQQEPLGRVLLEAAASGLPIVATRVGGTPEIVTDGVSARLVPPGDVGRLASAIGELYHSPEMCTRFANSARERVLSRFSIERAAEAQAGMWRNCR